MQIERVEKLFGDIERAVVSGELGSGEPISLKSIESRFGTSSIPAREVLIGLSFEELIDFNPGRGFSTRPLNLESYESQLDFMAMLLSDAADHIAASPARRDALGLYAEGVQTALDARPFDPVEGIVRLGDVFSRTYRKPQSDALQRLLFSCGPTLCADSLFHEGIDCLRTEVMTYFDLLVLDRVQIVKRLLGDFTRRRKARAREALYALERRNFEVTKLHSWRVAADGVSS